MNELAFSSIPVNGLLPKPRNRGLTMLMDLGIPLTYQADFLDMAGDYIDFAKMTMANSRLLNEGYLRKKIENYSANQIDAFPGGLFLEHAYSHGLTDTYLEWCHRVGYPAVEVSDNYLDFAPGAKSKLIRRICSEGLKVMAEVGRKEGTTDIDDMTRGINESLEAGATVVLVEAGELLKGRQGTVVEALQKAVPIERVLIELPGHWLPGVEADTNFQMMKSLINIIGLDVNLASLVPEEILILQNYRIEMGANIRLGDVVS